MKYQVSQKQVTRPTYDEIFDTHEEAEKYLNEIANEDYNGDKSGLEIRESELSLAAAAMGRAKTEKKAKSSRENGKKGGRPKQYEIITVYGDNGESDTFSCRDFGKTAMTKKEWAEILKEKFSGDLTICFGTES